MVTAKHSVVPVIDLRRFRAGQPGDKESVAREIDRACSDIGFLIVTGHGLQDGLLDRVLQVSEEYFDLPLTEKRAIPLTADYPFGYSGFEEETLARSLNEDSAPDLKESFSIGPYDPRADTPPTRWPARPPGFEVAWLAYYQAMEQLAATLLQSFAIALGLPEDWFTDKTDRHASAMRALSYPKLNRSPKTQQQRASAHTDYGCLTILAADGPGLQVQTRAGAWLDVPSVDGSFVVNLGDLLAHWTNDRWKSTLHRVVVPPLEMGKRRQSVAFFHNVNEDAVIECIETCIRPDRPAKYSPMTAGEHLWAKHAAAVEAS